MTDFGAGIFLTEDFDFEVTNTGDIRASRGVAELEKDLSVQSIIRLQSIHGIRETPQEKARLRARVREILTDDPRIDTVSDITISFIWDNDTVEISTSAISDNSQQELVFEI